MKLPNKEYAFVTKSKIKDYLLSEKHFVGRSKAKFFRLYGFDETNIDKLEKSLIQIAQLYDIKKEETSPHGKKYIIDGKLLTPENRSVMIRTIWIIDKNNDKPRLITAYPI